MLFVGVDWAEAHHDLCILDADGDLLAKRRIADSLAGVAELHGLIAEHLGETAEPDQVVVGIEKDRGLIVTALVAAGYQVYAINPMAASRYRDRHHVSGAKSDPGDAKVLADLVRTDRHNRRLVAGDSSLAEAIKAILPKKPPSGFMHATVGIYPPKRMVRRHTLELKKLKEAGFA